MPIKNELRVLAQSYSEQLKKQIEARVTEMESDDFSHFLIYRVLGVTTKEGKMVDIYQNKGRFLYKYAGSFLEEATKLCFKQKYPSSDSKPIPNTQGKKPKKFQIDCLVGNDAIEIKWRDATTDGDHVTKEHTRIQVIKDAGYKPIRIMFYSPNRKQAQKIQATLETVYKGVEGEYYKQDAAWDYVKNRTEIDLKAILEEIAEESAHEDE